MNWFGAHNRIRPSHDLTAISMGIGWSLALAILTYLAMTAPARRVCTLAVCWVSLAQGALLTAGVMDNCWLYGSSEIMVSRDRFHPGPKIQALLSVHLGLTTVNVSLITKHNYYNEEFSLSMGAETELRSALARGVPDSILTVLDFLAFSGGGVPIRREGYRINYLLCCILVMWMFSLLLVVMVPPMAPRGFLLIGGLSVMVPCVYFLCLPDLVFYIRVTGHLMQLRPGRSFYFVVLGGIFYISLGFAFSTCFTLKTAFEVDYYTPWQRSKESYINIKKETDSRLEHGDNIPAHKKDKERREKQEDNMCDKIFEEEEKETRTNDRVNASNEVLETRRETRCECIGQFCHCPEENILESLNLTLFTPAVQA